MKELARVFWSKENNIYLKRLLLCNVEGWIKKKYFVKNAMKGEIKKISLEEEMEWGDSRFNLYRYRRNIRN